MARLNSGKSVRMDLDFIPRLTGKVNKKLASYDKLMQARVERATMMIWTIAHQKRPLVTRAMADAWNTKKRVSDPNAQAGVPVDTGRLQASITHKVERNRKGFRGTVETSGVPYATAMEYGTTHIAARPFMRPAINLTRDALKRMFGLKVDSNT